jgi:hypothetical protein
VKEDWCKELSGIAFANAKLECVRSDGTKTQVTGPMLFTHFGLSGPATFSLSSQVAFESIDTENPLLVSISIDASKDYQTWDNELRAALEKEPSKLVKNVLSHFIPARFSDIILGVL